jgi:hypothetical protein
LLAITIDLVPGGYAPMRRTIASMSIVNISDLAEVSDYRIEAFEARNPLTGSPPCSSCCVVRMTHILIARLGATHLIRPVV